MVSKMLRTGFSLMALTALVACGHTADVRPNEKLTGPDEFSVVPSKPLQQPTDLSALPAPTPGGSNLTDPTPEADAIIALGGRPPAAGGVDGGIVNYASRYGVDPAIRADLAKSDARRSDGRRSFILFGKKTYEGAYKGYALDAQDEWERLRAAGVIVPAAPPQ